MNNKIKLTVSFIFAMILLSFNFAESTNTVLNPITSSVNNTNIKQPTNGRNAQLPPVSVTSSFNPNPLQPDGKYLSKNSTNFYVNEVQLNNTINDIAQNDVLTETMTITGDGTVISTNTVSYLITEIKVLPTTSTNRYHFLLTEYPSLNVIDQDRKQHDGTWDIEKNYGINSQVEATISGSTITEPITIEITYVHNGLTP